MTFIKICMYYKYYFNVSRAFDNPTIRFLEKFTTEKSFIITWQHNKQLVESNQ